MCLIVVIPKGVVPDYEALRSAMARNNDGWGLMRRGRRGPVIDKGMGDFNQFIDVYEKRYKGFATAIHFRYATHGDKDLINCHPYEISKNTWMMHNGIIGGLDLNADRSKSDSYHFGKLIEPYVKMGDLRTKQFQTMVEMMIGSGNKLVFMDPEGFLIANRTSGITDNETGIWYSNATVWNCPIKLRPAVSCRSSYGFGGHMLGDDFTDYAYTPAVSVKMTACETGAGQLSLPVKVSAPSKASEDSGATSPDTSAVVPGSPKPERQYEAIRNTQEYENWWQKTLGRMAGLTVQDSEGDISDEEAIAMIESAGGTKVTPLEDGGYAICEEIGMPQEINDWTELSPGQLRHVIATYPERTADFLEGLFQTIV